MRVQRYIGGLLLVVLGAAGPVSAQTNTARRLSHEVEARIKMAEANVERLLALAERVAQLQETATNQVGRSLCIHERLVQINGIITVSKTACIKLPVLAGEDNVNAFESNIATIGAAWERASKLALDAEKCVDDAPAKPQKHLITTPVVEPTVPRPAHPAKGNGPSYCLARRVYVVRSEVTCITQKHLARYLVRAMDNSWNTTKTPEDCVAELTKLGIAPLGGWQPEKGANLDDLCVILVRALKLSADSTDDPASCCQMLREQGLPIDAAFPGRSIRGDAPWLLDEEVRSFFAEGYAAPLPGARRL